MVSVDLLWRAWKILAFSVAGLILFAWVLRSLVPETEQAKREARRHAQRTEAIVVCRMAVEGQLRAPSTASFPGDEDVRDKGDGIAIVISSVDAQNAFGAKIRTRWLCEADVKDPKNGRVLSVALER